MKTPERIAYEIRMLAAAALDARLAGKMAIAEFFERCAARRLRAMKEDEGNG